MVLSKSLDSIRENWSDWTETTKSSARVILVRIYRGWWYFFFLFYFGLKHINIKFFMSSELPDVDQLWTNTVTVQSVILTTTGQWWVDRQTYLCQFCPSDVQLCSVSSAGPSVWRSDLKTELVTEHDRQCPTHFKLKLTETETIEVRVCYPVVLFLLFIKFGSWVLVTGIPSC